jgi:hypothetical protein
LETSLGTPYPVRGKYTDNCKESPADNCYYSRPVNTVADFFLRNNDYSCDIFFIIHHWLGINKKMYNPITGVLVKISWSGNGFYLLPHQKNAIRNILIDRLRVVSMAPAIKTRMILISPCLAVAAAMFILAGCGVHSGENPAPPALTDKTTLIPPGTISPAITAGPAEPKVNLTIHSAQKVPLIHGTTPNNGVWVIVDLSIENRDFPGGVPLKQNAMLLTDPETGQRYPPSYEDVQLLDRWTDGDIGINTTKRGEILFVTNTTPDSYMLTINDVSGGPLYQSIINTTRTREYSHTVTDTT